MQLKLPPEIVSRYGGVIRELDWSANESARLAEIFPDAGFGEWDRLERVMYGTSAVIRPATLGSANRLRAFASTLPAVPAPTADEIAAVLRRRNPEAQQ